MASASSAATWIALRSICRKGAFARTSAGRAPRLHRQSRINTGFNIHNTVQTHCRFSSSTSQTGSTAKTESHQKSDDAANPKATSKHKTRSPSSNTSLHRVAVEAQRSRGTLIKGKGKSRHVDPDAQTKDVTAYCAAERYDLHHAQALLWREGWITDPTRTEMFPQVLHVRTPTPHSVVGDVFVFPSGCLVAWNVPEIVARRLVDTVILPAAGGSHLDKLEEESLEYIEDATQETSSVLGDTIVLSTHATTAAGVGEPPLSSPSTHNSTEDGMRRSAHQIDQIHQLDTVLAKIAFSSAVARSTKLAVLEQQLADYFDTTRTIPATLSAGTQLRFTRAFILRKTGELLNLRAQLNLYSELTDALPDVFWDSPHELGLENYYDMMGRALDVSVRIKVLNERMDYASEIAAVLRERLSEKHSTGLEWMIIGLIMIEVGFGCLHLWREHKDRDQRLRTEMLSQEFLKGELAIKGVTV